MSVPTQGEKFSELLNHLRLAEEDAAMLAHLTRAQGGHKDNTLADGWLRISELLRKTCHYVTQLAQGKLQ